jgi:prepilin-type processing-associated H-X9-DG protein
VSVDVTGGRSPEQDFVLPRAPADPDYREGVNIWLQDDAGRFALPRFGVECIASSWERRGFQVNIAFADGRVIVDSGVGDALGPYGEDGSPTVLGAGQLRFCCITPFSRWTMSYAGVARSSTVADQLAGRAGEGEPIEVSVEVEMTMAVPPWIRGEMTTEARSRLAGTDEALFIGGVGGMNCKQLFRASGTARFGDEERTFTATGLRVHRQGVRKTGEFRGHVWQSAVFPSGKAFEALAFPDHPDGTPGYTEGFVFDGINVYPATVAQAPWMTEFVAYDGDVRLVLESALGRTEVGGSTRCSTAMPGAAATSGVPIMSSGASRHDLFFHQGSAEYSWGGETALGMIERSLPAAQLHVVRDGMYL